MPTTFEQVTFANTPVGTTNIPLTVTLVSSDLLITISTQGAGGARSVTTTGLGTWTRPVAQYAGDFNNYISYLTGVSGTGDVVITTVGSNTNTTLWVVRGLSDPTARTVVVGPVHGVISGGVNAAATSLVSFTPNQTLIGIATSVSGSAPVFPSTGSLPSIEAWTVDHNGVGSAYDHGVAHVIGGDGVTPHQLWYNKSGAHFIDGFSILLGVPAVQSVVLDTVYAEVPLVGTPAVALDTSYAEVPLVGTPEAALSTSYVEIIAPAMLATQVDTVYVEVVSGFAPEVAFGGWGVPRI